MQCINIKKKMKSAKVAIEFLDKETRKLNNDEYHPGIFGHF